MNSVENFGLDQLSNQAKFSFKSRDAPVSVSMQSSHNDSDGENILLLSTCICICIFLFVDVTIPRNQWAFPYFLISHPHSLITFVLF